MRNGDFSALTNPTGQRVIIYDPLTHQPFPGNIIPANRINPVSAAIIKYMPLPDVNVVERRATTTRASAEIDNLAQEYSGKVEHKFTDKVSLTGFYLWNHTDEPCSNYFEVGKNGATRFADPNDYLLKRTPQILALNNTWLLSDSSVLALRYGWTQFVDNSTMTIDFDPATLGFSPTFLSQVGQTGVPKFPQGDVHQRLQRASARSTRRTAPTSRRASTAASRSSSARTPSRWAPTTGRSASTCSTRATPSGNFQFDKEFTSSTGLNQNSTTEGDAFASFLLGYPTADGARQSTMTLTTPLDIYTNYYGGYLQDDWRVSSKFTLNYGLRIEHEDGIARSEQQLHGRLRSERPPAR